jgi:hypothetical protein
VEMAKCSRLCATHSSYWRLGKDVWISGWFAVALA